MSKLDSVQLEQLEAIGAYLSHIRQDQARSLEEISTKTFIPVRTLRALEAGKYEILPEPVFIQGFIRRYGDALGLDGKALAQEFPMETLPPEPELVPYEEPEPRPRRRRERQSPPSIDRSNAHSNGDSDDRAERPAAQPGRLSVIVPAALVGLAVLGGLGYWLSHLGTAKTSSVAVQQTTSAPKTAPAASAANPSTAKPAPAAVGSESATSGLAAAALSSRANAAGKNAPVTVDISLTGRCWLQVKVDDELKFEGTLDKGSQRRWEGKEKVTVLAGNAGAVQIAHNQSAAKVMGNVGSVQEVTYTADRAAKN